MRLPQVKLPKGTTVKTLEGLASFNRIVLNYLRMQRLLEKAEEEEREEQRTDKL